MRGGVGVFDKEYQSAPVNCKADRLSTFGASRAKMSAIRTRHDKTMLLVTKGDNGHFRTLRAITYKKRLNKSNAILAACLHLLATFGLECRAFACKKNTICKKVGGGAVLPLSKVGGQAPPLPLPVRRLCYYLHIFGLITMRFCIFIILICIRAETNDSIAPT